MLGMREWMLQPVRLQILLLLGRRMLLLRGVRVVLAEPDLPAHGLRRGPGERGRRAGRRVPHQEAFDGAGGSAGQDCKRHSALQGALAGAGGRRKRMACAGPPSRTNTDTSQSSAVSSMPSMTPRAVKVIFRIPPFHPPRILSLVHSYAPRQPLPQSNRLPKQLLHCCELE